MQLAVQSEIEVQTCHHRGVCDCAGMLVPVEVHGCVHETDGGLAVEIVDVDGMPDGFTLSDLDPAIRGQFERALSDAAEKKLAQLEKLERLPASIQRVITSLRVASAFRSDAGDGAKDELIGALRFALTKTQEELERLVKEAA